MSLSNDHSRSPPGPAAPVVLGIDAPTLGTLQQLQREFGSVVALTTVNGRNALFINDAEDIRTLLVRHHARYLKGPGFERVKMLLGNGLIVSDGDIWRRSRRMIQPSFSRQNVHRLLSVMTRCTESRMEAWEKVVAEGGTLDITQEMSDFSLELILRCLFGGDYDTKLMRTGENPFAFLSKESERNLRVVLQVRETRQLILEIICDRRQHADHEEYDFLSGYLAATDKDGKGFSDEELLDEIVTLIVAGYETSAGTLNWAWYLLATHPESEAALLEEARQWLTDRDKVDEAALSAMTFTGAVLEETLRLYPPVWLFTRRAAADDALKNYRIKAGTDIYLSPYILHRTETYWPEPDVFAPGRFAEATDSRKGERPYFPFSLGPRRCLGEYFSFLEMKVHLGLLVQKFRMTVTTESPPELDLGINLRSAQSIILRPQLRSKSEMSVAGSKA